MYDIIIIGAGTAGFSAYKQAIKYTDNVLIINDGPWDTTCARVGCMPSKVLISSANRLYDAQHADTVGLDLEVTSKTKNIMTHVRHLRDQFTQGMLDEAKKWKKQHKISGKAHFIDAHTVEVNGKSYESKSFILAVGSSPNLDATLKEKIADRLISTDQVFELDHLPKSMAVIGGGAIALELSSALSRLGVDITVFVRNHRLGSLTSPQLQQHAQEIVCQQLKIKFDTTIDDAVHKKNHVELQFKEDGKLQKLNVDYVLSAIGRHSNLNTLALENIDKQYQDLEKIRINKKTKQLAEYPIFVVGDAFSDTPLQHEAAHQGREAIQNCLTLPKVKKLRQLTPLSIVFCSPEMAMVGKSYAQLQKKKVNFVTGSTSYANQGRAKVLGKNQGTIEIYIHSKSKKILGAELLVENAEHFAHLLAWMIDQGATLDNLLSKPFYHPTMEEGLRTACIDAAWQLKNISK